MLSVGVELVPPSATEVPLGDRRRRPGASKPAQERRPLLKCAPRSAARSCLLAPNMGSVLIHAVHSTHYGVPTGIFLDVTAVPRAAPRPWLVRSDLVVAPGPAL